MTSLVKDRDVRSQSLLSPSSTIIDPSGPLTPDSVVLVNPFTNANSLSTIPSIRRVGEYELSETKFDDFKCARHATTGENLLYKEYPFDTIRKRFEPYNRLTSFLLSSEKNRQESRRTSTDQLASKYNFHFYRDIVQLEQNAVVIYPSYVSNLHTHITEKQRLTENQSKNLFSQIARAMKICHQVGLIVRDLKLRKIVFPDQRQSHLLLTGLEDAIVLASPNSTDDFVSSRFSCPVYACPEIVLNRQMYSGKLADSWSLGVILYTMLFGRYPFCDRTLMGLFMKIGRCRLEIPRSVSFEARSLLRSLIRMKPNERLSVSEILGHVWFNEDRDSSQIQLNPTDESNNVFQSKLNNDDADAIVPNFL